MSNFIENGRLIAFHPGYYVKEYLERQNMNQAELAKRLQISEKDVSKLVNGKKNLNEKLIDNLAIALGTSRELWENLDKKYKIVKRQIEEENKIERDKLIQKNMDYSFWKKLRVVKDTKDTSEQVKELRKFLRIVSLEVLKKDNFLVQYKTAVKNIDDKNIINANAWVQTALNIGNIKSVESIDLNYLKSKLPDIRNMTVKDPQIFLPELRRIFKKSGVAFVLLPNLKNSGINGAVKWLGDDKVLLAMNNRRKYADTFWFALFHEIKHVFQQKKGHIIISGDNESVLNSKIDMLKLENEADKFAQEILIPSEEYNSFLKKEDFSSDSIEEFSRKINIQPGIVVGRLQRDKYIDYGSSLNKLKIKYIISR